MHIPETQNSKVDPTNDVAASAYLSGLAPQSQRTMVAALHTCAQIISGVCTTEVVWSSVTYEQVAALRGVLASRYAPATANKLLSAVRGVLRAASMLGLLDPVQAARAISVRSIRGQRLLKGRWISPCELRSLCDSCDGDSIIGARDRALLLVTYGCGLRRSEAVLLDLDSWDRADCSLTVLGKGNVQRTAYLPEEAECALERWVALRGKDAGPLFLPVTRGGRIQKRRLSDQAVYNLISRVATRVGVEHLSPHDLRRTFITTLLDRGVDISTVQRMAAHASVTTTVRYDRRGLEAQRRAASLL